MKGKGPRVGRPKAAGAPRRRRDDDRSARPDTAVEPPKPVAPYRLAERKRRESGAVPAGRRQVEGDQVLGKRLAEALTFRGETGRATHGFHAYPARLHPDTARAVLDILPATRVADPFCGGGTVLVEALLHGAEAVGGDLSAIALMVARARTTVLEEEGAEKLREAATGVVQGAMARLREGPAPWIAPAVLRLRRWYQDDPLHELAALQNLIEKAPAGQRKALTAVFSSLCIKFSLRASETSNRVVEVHRPRGAVLQAFVDKVEHYAIMQADFRALLPTPRPSVSLAQIDARNANFQPVDLVLTSPPYPGTYDYLLLQQLRSAWLGLDTAARADDELGSRRKFRLRGALAYRQWLADTRQWMHTVGQRITPAGRMAVVVGEGIAAGRHYAVAEPTKEAAEAAGLRFVCGAAVERIDPALKRRKQEHILLFERPEK